MKRLNNTQIYIMVGLTLVGFVFIMIDILSLIITLSIGYTCIFLGILLMAMECGPEIWYWWVPFGLGVRYEVDEQIYESKYEDIMHWTVENFGESIKYYNHGTDFYFLRKTDAIAFKLAWEK